MAHDVEVSQAETHRLIPTKYAGGLSVLEQLNLPGDVIADLTSLDAATNDRKTAEEGSGLGIGPWELLYGVPLAPIVNAAYAHPGLQGSRFNDSQRGAWYAGFTLQTAQSEVAHHKRRFLRNTRFEGTEIYDYQDILADFHGVYSALDDAERAQCLAPDPLPDCYRAGQALAMGLLNQGKSGIVYPSVRDQPEGICLVCFRPALITHPRYGARFLLTIDMMKPPGAEQFQSHIS